MNVVKPVLKMLHQQALNIALNMAIFTVVWFFAQLLTRRLFNDPDFSILAGLFIATYFVQIKLRLIHITAMGMSKHAASDGK